MPDEQVQCWKPSISPKQATISQMRKKFILVSGPRESSKTLGILSDLMNEAFYVPRASIAIVAISQTNAVDGGVWEQLTTLDRDGDGKAVGIAQQWIDGGFGMEWVTKPRTTKYTHKSFLTVKNYWGGTSTVQLYTLPREDAVEKVFKSKSFTSIYITELSNFSSRFTFDTLSKCLRGSGRPQTHFRFVADTNPSDEGQDSWIYKLWYEDRVAPWNNEQRFFYDQLGLIEFTVDDNIFYSEEKKEELRQQWSYDQNLYARMYEGKWVRRSSSGFFQDVFRPGHIIGENPTPTKPEPEQMTVQDGCVELMDSSDLGSGINHGVAFIEPFWSNGKMSFKCLDELISVGEQISTEEYAEQWVEKRAFWTKEAGGKIFWESWGDSDINKYEAAADTTRHKIVLAVSKGEIWIQGATKGQGSVMKRFNMLRQLFFEDRLFISARCVQIIDALRNIKREISRAEKEKLMGNKKEINPNSPWKHAIDALSYGIKMKMADEIDKATLVNTRPMARDVFAINL